MTKQAIRNKYKKLRSNLQDEVIDAYSLEIANRLLSLDIWQHNYYHIFLPISRLREINTEYLLSILGGFDKHIVVACADFEQLTMQHYLLTDNTKIVNNSYGIPEPQDGIEIDVTKIDVVFIPLLAYDTKGNRLGYGKGFYDRFLQQCREDTIKVGLSLFDPEDKPLPSSPHDVALEFCVTMQKTHQF